MPFEYKCQSCQAIGDLDSLVDQVECPNCGGMMVPDNAPPVPPAQPAAPDGTDEGETPTTIVPRAEILKEIAATADQPKKVVKVAKFVNIGFGGMLTTSATRGFKPITPGKTDTGLPFSKQSPFPQQPQKQKPPPEKEAVPERVEPAARKQAASSSSTNLGGQRKKTFTVSKSKTAAPPMQQTSTQHMDATQFDPGTAAATPQQEQTDQSAAPVQPQREHPQAPEEILPKLRISGPATSTPLKFLPKGALKVAQTHTAIQRSQIPPPPSKLMPQPQQQVSRQYEQPSSNFPEQDEDFAAQVRIEAERREAILREAYRIAEEKLRKEREETEKISAEKKAGKEEKEALQTAKAEHAAREEAKTLVAQIAKELAETEELIRKERETLELRKKELQEIRKSAEDETAKAKYQENKTILLTPQKPVKLKSGEGAESLMRSSKNLQIDKKMLETGKLVLRKEELEMMDSKPGGITETKKDDADAKKSVFKGFPTSPPLNKKGLQVLLAAKNATGKSVAGRDSNEDVEKEKSSGPDIAEAPEKDKMPTKTGIDTDAPMTNSTLLKIQKRKKTVILFIVGLAVAIVCLLIFFIGGEIVKTIKSSFSPAPVVAPSLPILTQSLQMEYNAVYKKIKKTPANRQEIDANIKELQDFIDSHPNAPDTDKYINDAKTHIKTMQDLKELY